MSLTQNDLLEALKSINQSKVASTPKEYRYVIYARKSTDDSDKQVRSLSDQIIECEEFAKRNGLRVVTIIQESESAKEPDIRPKFREMIDKLKAGKYDGVIAWHPDRLARNMKDAGEIIDLVDKRIVKDLKFVSFTFENTTSGKMLLGMTFVLSKQYSDNLSDNVSRGNKRSIEEGKYINKAKHGYFKDSGQLLRPDGDNFLLIKKVFAMRLEGKTLDEIAEYLNEGRYTRFRKDGSRKAYKMDKQRVAKFLKDPVYTGVLLYGKHTANLMELYDFQPMITVEDFMKINKLSNEKQYLSLAKSYRKAESVKADLMRGMVLCGDCDEPMSAGITSKKWKGAVTNYFYYRCENDECEKYGKSLRAKVVMDYIYQYLEGKPFSSQKSYDHYVEEMKRLSVLKQSEARSNLSRLQSSKTAAEGRLARVKELLATETDESIKESFRADFRLAEADVKAAESNIEKAKATIESGKEPIYEYKEFLELMENMPRILRSMKNMSEIDFIVKKIFLNFTIQGKNVVDYTLNHPFNLLDTSKVSVSGRRGT